MKVVPDTNVFVSSVLSEGPSNKIIGMAVDGKIRIYTSMPILLELEKVIRRDFKFPEDKVQEELCLIMSLAQIEEPKTKFFTVKEDPSDNMFLDLAFHVNADFIVSRDKHLLKLKKFGETKIVSPREFLAFIL